MTFNSSSDNIFPQKWGTFFMGKWCDYSETSGFFFTYYYCTITGEKVEVSSSMGENYCCNYNKSGECIRYKNYKGPSSNGALGCCFITTVTCGILKKEDNDPVMEGLRKFRDEVLQKNEEYSNVLKLYDRIGPIISCRINHDRNRDEKASQIYSKLEEFVNIINNGEYKKVTNRYIMMTLRLICEYHLQEMYKEIRDDNFGFDDGEFDLSKAGHGRIYKKTLDK